MDLKLHNYDNIIALCIEEVDSKSVINHHFYLVVLTVCKRKYFLLKGDVGTKRLARLLRGTFYSLLGEHDKAVADYSAVFEDQEAASEVDRY